MTQASLQWSRNNSKERREREKGGNPKKKEKKNCGILLFYEHI
jgi:hypothetical protein